MYKAIKEFLKPTKWTIIATVIVIIVYMIDQDIVARTWPAETIFLTVSTIFLTPIGFIRDAIYVLLSVDKYSFFAGLISFVLDILYYYVWGCIIVYIIKLYKKRAIKK
jgi:hypothetical protein